MFLVVLCGIPSLAPHVISADHMLRPRDTPLRVGSGRSHHHPKKKIDNKENTQV